MATVGKYTGPMDGMGTKTSTSRPTFETCHRVPYKLPTIAGHQFQHQGQGNRFFSPVRFFRSTLGDMTNVERELNRDMGINCDLNRDILKVSFGYSQMEFHFELLMNSSNMMDLFKENQDMEFQQQQQNPVLNAIMASLRKSLWHEWHVACFLFSFQLEWYPSPSQAMWVIISFKCIFIVSYSDVCAFSSHDPRGTCMCL